MSTNQVTTYVKELETELTNLVEENKRLRASIAAYKANATRRRNARTTTNTTTEATN